METAVIKYNAGNVLSVVNALKRLGIDPIVTDDAATIRRADKVIFPGVGEASTTMAYLRAHGLDQLIISLKQPVLGICIGLQLMCRHSAEGSVDCLGIFDTEVRRFPSTLTADEAGRPVRLKVPEMGWNTIHSLRSGLFSPEMEQQYVYFVHSYYAEPCAATVALADYGLPFSAALHRDNFYAVQFHPEKSAALGERVLHNFLSL